MREIIFRGKRIDNGEWVEGYYLYTEENTHPVIIDMKCCSHIIIPETVGQFTGLTDKNGNKIFEGDIMSGKFSNYVFWYDEDEKGFCYGKSYKDICRHSCSSYAMSISESDINIIGNVHDNPELMKGE